MSQQHSNIEAVFSAAIEIRSPREREAFLEHSCGDDSTLRTEVDRLLRAHFAAEGFLESPAAQIAPATNSPSLEKLGSSIGPYRIVEELGEGGFGVVYMAEQEAPVRRRVALKVIKPGMDSRQVVARFEAERQALAVMDHPHVSRVLDGGSTDSGRPYFIMDLIQGLPITEFCDQASLSTRQRLELFRDVCMGIEHAHQKGIIHRDIKPSNVLVTLHDARAVPKVIDFGVAKALHGSLSGQTVYTRYEQLIGTPLYMSPEQISRSGVDVDTRTDVYSLGVLLYELLTGVPPIDSSHIGDKSYDEVRRIIQEDQPQTPSQKLSTTRLEALATIATRRQIDPVKLPQLLRGDLDWITMKALEKDRTRRYATASAFAIDVERYLADEPVEARPTSTWYRFGKFARRNRLAFAFGAAVLVSLTAVIGSVGWFIGERTARYGEAERQAGQAVSVAEQSIESQDWPTARLALTRATGLLVRQGSGPQIAARVGELTQDLDMIERLERIRLELAELHGESGQPDVMVSAKYRAAFEAFGLPVETLSVDEAVARIRERSIAVELAEGLAQWALRVGKKERRQTRENLLAIVRQVDPDPSRNRILTLWTGADQKTLTEFAATVESEELSPFSAWLLATVLVKAEAREQAITVLERAQRRHPGDYWLNHALAHELHMVDRWAESLRYASNLVALLPKNYISRIELGRALIGNKLFDEAVAQFQETVRLFPDDARPQSLLGEALLKNGLVDEGLAALHESVRLDPTNALWHSRLGNALRNSGRLDEGIEAYREALRLDPSHARAHSNLGKALEQKGLGEESVKAYREAVRLEPKSAAWRSNLGNGLAQQGLLDEAVKEFREAVRLAPHFAPPHSNLGKALQAQGAVDDAIKSYRECIRLDPRFTLAYYNLGNALMAQKRPDEAVTPYRELVRLAPDAPWAHDSLGSALSAKGLVDEAIDAHREAIRLRPAWACYHHHLGRALMRKGDRDEAISALEASIPLHPKHDAHALDLASALLSADRFQEARDAFREALRMHPENPQACNGLAWLLATCPEITLRDPERAVELARKAAEMAPQNSGASNTLGVAEYRVENWSEAIAALEKSMELSAGGTSFDFFFLAMALWQRGDREDARAYYAKALAWADKHQPKNLELHRFRAEAEILLKE